LSPRGAADAAFVEQLRYVIHEESLEQAERTQENGRVVPGDTAFLAGLGLLTSLLV